LVARFYLQLGTAAGKIPYFMAAQRKFDRYIEFSEPDVARYRVAQREFDRCGEDYAHDVARFFVLVTSKDGQADFNAAVEAYLSYGSYGDDFSVATAVVRFFLGVTQGDSAVNDDAAVNVELAVNLFYARLGLRRVRSVSLTNSSRHRAAGALESTRRRTSGCLFRHIRMSGCHVLASLL
jgi:hypothetical protein